MQMLNLSKQYETVRYKIADAEVKFGRLANSVELIVVSKNRSVAEIKAIASAGQSSFAESYLQEAESKINALANLNLQWHFIGPIQSNKTKGIAALFDWVHSIDRVKIAERLHKQRTDRQKRLNICLQVNMAGEATKGGVSFAELPELLASVKSLSRLKLRGIMTIPPRSNNLSAQRNFYHKIYLAYKEIQQHIYPLDVLSMGMSSDFEAAIAEGATLVRIGTLLFEPREG